MARAKKKVATKKTVKKKKAPVIPDLVTGKWCVAFPDGRIKTTESGTKESAETELAAMGPVDNARVAKLSEFGANSYVFNTGFKLAVELVNKDEGNTVKQAVAELRRELKDDTKRSQADLRALCLKLIQEEKEIKGHLKDLARDQRDFDKVAKLYGC